MLDHADVPWSLPPSLPAVRDLQAAAAILTVPPATPKHVAWCLAKLTLAFEPNSKLDAEATKLRAAVWLEALADLGDELWSQATIAALQSSKFMPKPAELRHLVDGKLAERARKLKRCQAMIDAQSAVSAKPAEKPIETRLGRMEHTREVYRRLGRRFDVERLDREIALAKGEAVPAAVADMGIPASEERPAFTPSTTGTAKRCAELARARHTGQPAPEHRDFPEGQAA